MRKFVNYELRETCLECYVKFFMCTALLLYTVGSLASERISEELIEVRPTMIAIEKKEGMKEYPEKKLSASYLKRDVCHTSNIPEEGCAVDGIRLEVELPLNSVFYNYASIERLESIAAIPETGRPYIETDTVRVGLGALYDWSEDLKMYVEAGLVSSADMEYIFDNPNSNEGYEVLVGARKTVARNLKVGIEGFYEYYQNCSSPDCHGLKSKKPKMDMGTLKVYLSYQYNSQYSISYKLEKIVVEPNKSLFNGRDVFDVGHELELKYFLNR